jgi:hypothetical protein
MPFEVRAGTCDVTPYIALLSKRNKLDDWLIVEAPVVRHLDGAVRPCGASVEGLSTEERLLGSCSPPSHLTDAIDGYIYSQRLLSHVLYSLSKSTLLENFCAF